MTTNAETGLVPVPSDLDAVEDVLAEVAILTITDVLAACGRAGMTWRHPRWESGKTRWCAAMIDLPNGWVVSLGCCDSHYCSHRDLFSGRLDIYGETKKPEEWFASPDAEIAIFRPDGSWYVPEGEEPEGDTWVGGWWDADRIWRTITYLSGR